MKTLKFTLICALSASVLTACSKTKEQFDFSKKAPDEFAVVTRAPLEMPDNYDLPPPRLGAERPQETAPEEQAKQTLFGEESTSAPEAVTSGEVLLLERTGAATVDPNIRNVIDQETAEVIEENTSTFNKILGKAGRKTDAPAEVIDPVKERERLILEQQK